jgi:hypothetical protein
MATFEYDEFTLKDGFSDFSSYSGHKLPVKGLLLLDESTQTFTTPTDQFITWDMKQIHMWRLDRILGTIKTTKILKHPHEKPNFIITILFIQKLHLILMSASDLTFKLYDRDLNFLESIKHQEGTILGMEYDNVSNRT